MKKNMKKSVKRVVSMMLALGMLLGLTGCGGGGNSTSQSDIDATFPLKEEVTLTFMVVGTEDTSFKEKMANNKLWKRLQEETNVNVEFQFLGETPEEKFTLLINGGNYGDVLIGGPVLNSISASRYFASGIFQDLTEYLNKETMPNLMAMIDENPDIMGMISGADGKVYTLPQINGIEGGGLESPFWINKVWLDKLGLAVPTTLDEFTNVLRAFKTQDPNGNGVQDEIPYFVSTAREFYSLEAIYGCWGLAFKNGALDGFATVKDGEVRFGPVLDEYKEAVKYQALLYDEGLMWNECFTASSATGGSKLTSDICTVGCFTSNTIPTSTYMDDYVCLVPPKVEGYEQCWYVNPVVTAAKDRFYITDKCQYTEIVMKFMDLFYDFDNAFEVEFGAEEDGRWYKDENGNYVVRNDLTVDQETKIKTETPALLDLIDRFARGVRAEDMKKVINKDYDTMNLAWRTYQDAGVLNDEIWPRPYYSNEDASSLYRITTDIFYQVDSYRARWITGEGDIDAEWDEYIKKLEGLGLKEMVTIYQSGYDSYLELIK